MKGGKRDMWDRNRPAGIKKNVENRKSGTRFNLETTRNFTKSGYFMLFLGSTVERVIGLVTPARVTVGFGIVMMIDPVSLVRRATGIPKPSATLR